MHILTLEKAIELEKWVNESLIAQNEKEKTLLYPTLEPSSRHGSRADFLDKALKRMKNNPDTPLVDGDFYTGYMSHITFRSHEGKIYSWFESLTSDETLKFSFKSH
jgi:hypothetical protein